MKFLEELSEAQSNLSYAYANLKRNSKQANVHDEMRQFKQRFANFFNHVESYTKKHGNNWLFNTMQSTDIMSEEEKDVEDILVIDDDFDFGLYKSYLSESIKQNSVIKGNMDQSLLILGQDPRLGHSEEESQTMATNAINQATWATLQAEQSLQLYTRIANQNNVILDKNLREDIPVQLMKIRKKSLSLLKMVNKDNDADQEQPSVFSVDESMISLDTQQELQQQKQQYTNILDSFNKWTQESNLQFSKQNQDLYSQSVDHLQDNSFQLLPSTELSGKNGVLRRMQQTNNSLKKRYMQKQVLDIIENSSKDDAMNSGGSVQQMYSMGSSKIPDGTIDSDNLLDYLVQDTNQGRYTNEIMQGMQQSMGKKMAAEIIDSVGDGEDQSMGDFVLKRFERFIPNQQYLKVQQLYKVLKDPKNNEDKVFHFCRDYLASNRLEKQVVTQLLHNAGYSNSFDTDNLNYLGTDVFFQESGKLQGNQKKQLQSFNTGVMDGSRQYKVIDLQSNPDDITEAVLSKNQTPATSSNVDQLRTIIKKHVVDFMHDSKNGGDIFFNYDLVSLNSSEQIIHGKINQIKFDLDYSTKETTDYQRSLDLNEVQNAIYLERMLNTMRISKMVSKDYGSYFTSNFSSDDSLSDVEKAYRSQQIENVMSAFEVPYKLRDNDNLIEQKSKPVTERKSINAIGKMTKKFLNEIVMLKMADEELAEDMEDLQDYGGSEKERLFMDKLLYSVERDEKPRWLMTCTYMESADKSELGLNIPMGKYEQQFVQDLIRSPFWHELPLEKQENILQSRVNKQSDVLRRLNLYAFDDKDLAGDFKNYRISKDVQDMSETFNVQVQNFMHQLAKVPSVDVIDYPLIQKINAITTGFSQAYNYYVGGQNKQDAQSSVDKVRSIYTHMKTKFNLEDLSQGKVIQNSKVYENLLEQIHSQYFSSSSAPFNQRQLEQYVKVDEKIPQMMRSSIVNKGLKNIFNVSMVGAGLLAMTMATSPYVVQSGVPLAQNIKMQSAQYANKASSIIYEQMKNQAYTGGGFEIDYVASSLDTLSRVKASASKDDPAMTLDNLKAYQLGDDSVSLYQYITHQQLGESVSNSIKDLYNGGYSLYQTAKEVVDPLGTAREQTEQRKYYEQLSDIATLSSKNLKDDYLQRRDEGTLGQYKDDRTVQQRVQDLEQAVRQMTYYDVSAVAIKDELGQDDKIKQNTSNMIKDLEDVVLFQVDQPEPSLLFNALNLDKENVYAQSHLLPSIFKSDKFQRKLPFLDHAIYASNVQTQETMGQLKDDNYIPGDDNYYNAQLSKTIWANYSVGKEVVKTPHFKINLTDGDNIDKGEYIDVFDLRQYVPQDDMRMFERIELATLKAYDSGEKEFKNAVDQYRKLKQKDQAFEQLYDSLIQQGQTEQTNQVIKRSGVITSGQFFDIKSPLLYNTVYDPNYLISSDGGANKSVFDSDIYQTVALKLASQVQIIQQSKESQLRDSLAAMEMDKNAQINGVYVKDIMDWDNLQPLEEIKESEVRQFKSRALSTANTNRRIDSQYYLQKFQEFSNQYIPQSDQIKSIVNELDSITSSKSMASFAVFAGSIMYSLFSKVKRRMIDTEGQEIGAKDLTNNIRQTIEDGMTLKRNLNKQLQFNINEHVQEHQKLLINQRTNVNELQQISTAVDKVKSNVKTGLDAVSQLVIEPALQPVTQSKVLNNIQSANRILSDVNVDQYQKALPLISTNSAKEEMNAIENSLQMQEKSQQLMQSDQGKSDIKQVSSLVQKDDEFSFVFDKMQNQTQQAFQKISEKLKKSEEDAAAAAAAAAPKLQNDARTIGSLLGGRKSEESIQSMHDKINFMEGNLKRTLGNINTNIDEYLKPSPYQLIGQALNRRNHNPISDQLMSAGMPSFIGNSKDKKVKSKKSSVLSVLNSKRAKKLKKKQKKKRK